MSEPHSIEGAGAPEGTAARGLDEGCRRCRSDLPLRLHRALLARGETVAAAESLTAGLFCADPGRRSRRQRDAARRRGRVRHRAEDGAGRGARRPAGRARPGQPADRRSRSPRGCATAARADLGDRPDRRAGPDPVDGHGPGRVYLGIAGAAGTDVVELDLPGDRAAVRAGAVAAAMEHLLARLG